MKKMDTSYQTISRNFFKDLFASKEEDVKFDLSVYTKQYSSIHNLYSTLFNGFQDFDHLTRLETIFLQRNTPEKIAPGTFTHSTHFMLHVMPLSTWRTGYASKD